MFPNLQSRDSAAVADECSWDESGLVHIVSKGSSLCRDEPRDIPIS